MPRTDTEITNENRRVISGPSANLSDILEAVRYARGQARRG